MASLLSGFGVDWKAEFDKFDMASIQRSADESRDLVHEFAKKVTEGVNKCIESFVEDLNKITIVDRADTQYMDSFTTIYHFYSKGAIVGTLTEKKVSSVDWVNHPHTYKVEFTSKVYI